MILTSAMREIVGTPRDLRKQARGGRGGIRQDAGKRSYSREVFRTPGRGDISSGRNGGLLGGSGRRGRKGWLRSSTGRTGRTGRRNDVACVRTQRRRIRPRVNFC